METKYCKHCDKTKNIVDFSLKKGKPGSRCKSCFSEYYKNYYEKNPDKYEALKNRVNSNASRSGECRIKKVYKLTDTEYQELVNKNKGMCDLCLTKKATCVDHDHLTGKVRGYLCLSCNTGIGKLGDTIEGLEKALEYLKSSL